jgi:hypothetical protein
MCVIIDANVAHTIRSAPPDPDAVPLVQRILARRVGVVSGGRNAEELYRAGLGDFLITLARAGVLSTVGREELEVEERRLREEGRCQSDDHHVLALARLSGARLLYSRDQGLHSDFKNQQIIANPRGKIYSSPKHVRLLQGAGLCRQ